MIKSQAEELAQIGSAQRLLQIHQITQNSSNNSVKIQFPFLEQNLYFTYPSPPYWNYEQAYQSFPPLPYNFRHFEHLLCPPQIISQNNTKVNQPQTKEQRRETRSEQDSPKRIKFQTVQGYGQEADFIPPQYLKEMGRRQPSRQRKPRYTSYYWSVEQNKRYMQFLVAHPGLFELSLNVKKNLRVNVMMSKKVKSRSPQQCHSHHQKMMNKHGSIEQVIHFLQNETVNKEKGKIQVNQVKVEDCDQGNQLDEL